MSDTKTPIVNDNVEDARNVVLDFDCKERPDCLVVDVRVARILEYRLRALLGAAKELTMDIRFRYAMSDEDKMRCPFMQKLEAAIYCAEEPMP